MTRLEKCEILKSKGYTYDPETGKIYNPKGCEIIKKENGYIFIRSIRLKGHHFAWYMTYGNVEFNLLDHINRNREDNRISNLRIVTDQQNAWNNNCKGFYWNKNRMKWRSQIKINNKQIHLGYFNTEEEARDAYLIAKEKYHIIKKDPL
jgi:hypothetical protein